MENKNIKLTENTRLTSKITRNSPCWNILFNKFPSWFLRALTLLNSKLNFIESIFVSIANFLVNLQKLEFLMTKLTESKMHLSAWCSYQKLSAWCCYFFLWNASAMFLNEAKSIFTSLFKWNWFFLSCECFTKKQKFCQIHHKI